MHLKHHTAQLRYTQLYILIHTVDHTLATMGEEKVLVAWNDGWGWRREEEDRRVDVRSADTGKQRGDGGTGNHATMSMTGLRHQVQKDNQWATV